MVNLLICSNIPEHVARGRHQEDLTGTNKTARYWGIPATIDKLSYDSVDENVCADGGEKSGTLNEKSWAATQLFIKKFGVLL